MSDRDQVENLMARYCRTYDDGDFEGYARLFQHGQVGGPTGTFTTVEEVAAYHRRNCLLYDGKPNTRHVVTNIEINIAGDAQTATAASYVIIYQATSDFPLQVIFVGSYHDRFHKVDGEWWFADRRAEPHLVGDLSRHAVEYLPPTGPLS